MLREYDFTVIARGDLSDGDVSKVLNSYESLMTKDGGEILKRDEWGNRRLTYPIKKVFRGHYVNYDFVGAPENVAEIERLMRIDDNVLRYMAIRLTEDDNTVDVSARKAELAKAEKEAREAEQKRRRE